jgi:hypothetical protein
LATVGMEPPRSVLVSTSTIGQFAGRHHRAITRFPPIGGPNLAM